MTTAAVEALREFSWIVGKHRNNHVNIQEKEKMDVAKQLSETSPWKEELATLACSWSFIC